MIDNGSPTRPATTGTNPVLPPTYRPNPSPLKEGWPKATTPPTPFDPDQALRSYQPIWAWESDAITPRQECYLRSLGAAPPGVLTKGEACHLIKEILQGPPTFDQWQKLTRLGLWRDGITRQEAQELCNRPGARLAGK
jgi:hypothetical protein